MDRFADFIENPVLFREQLWFYPARSSSASASTTRAAKKFGTLEIPVTIPKR